MAVVPTPPFGDSGVKATVSTKNTGVALSVFPSTLGFMLPLSGQTLC